MLLIVQNYGGEDVGSQMIKMFRELPKILSPRNLSIKNKFVLYYSILILVFVTILSTIAYAYSTKIIRDKSIGYTLGILEQIRNNIDINLEQIDLASYLVFANRDILDILKDIQQYITASDPSKKYTVDKLLSDVVFSRRDIFSISVFDMKGVRIDTNFLTPDISFEELSRRAARLDGKMTWLEYDKKLSIIPAVRQVRDMEMNLLGCMQMNIYESSISSICSEQFRNMEGSVYVVNGDGTIVSGNDRKLLGRKVDTSIKSRLDPRKPGYVLDDVNGKYSIIGFYPSRINDWQYVSVIPLASITKDTALIRNIILFSSLIAIILFILVSYYLTTGLTGPLKLITEQMKKAHITDWTPQISYEGSDEIAYLTREFNSMVIRINNLVSEVIEQKSRLSRQELKALQSQINPHFLYNTLEIVNWMARTRNAPEIAEIVKALSDMMRYITSHKEEIVTVEKEIEYVKMYCLIQQARYRDKFTVTYEVEDEVLDCGIPKLSLQPIIENAILHAFSGIKRIGKIRVTGKIIDGKARLQIIDNGNGIDPQTVHRMLEEEIKPTGGSHAGIGVSNVNRRIKLIFGSEYGLEIISIPGEGSVFAIWLPLSAQKEERYE